MILGPSGKFKQQTFFISAFILPDHVIIMYIFYPGVKRSKGAGHLLQYMYPLSFTISFSYTYCIYYFVYIKPNK